MASGHDDNSHCETAVLPRHVESTYKSRSENKVFVRYRQKPLRIRHSKAQLINSYTIDDCHCSTLRERDFPRYPLPTILLHTTSATSSRLSSSFLSRLLTAVCQPSTLPYFSRVLVRSGAARASGLSVFKQNRGGPFPSSKIRSNLIEVITKLHYSLL
ncbi:hypothetical protein ALC56_06954 [Trachymyrmex septentrionalis]|uniref:Uncharacterized protein n=1 Tax=Trachymyrmex septentrionalis TaxID=34720 RepID=A0A151JX99_9HYME|nr:hypothetical protein ALC56_06954 [Trachymyrmex septentrionalis]